MSCSCDITLIITHTASQRAPRRKKWTVSESEVAKPNLNTLEVITQKERKKKKKKCFDALVHFSQSL